MEKSNPLKDPLKVEKDKPVRNVVRFWLIALSLIIVGLLLFTFIIGFPALK